MEHSGARACIVSGGFIRSNYGGLTGASRPVKYSASATVAPPTVIPLRQLVALAATSLILPKTY